MEEKNEQNPDVEQETQNNEEESEESNESTEDSKESKEESKDSDKDAEIAKLKRQLKRAKSDNAPKNQKSDEKLEEKLNKLALKTEGIVEADEVELARKLQEETGKEMDDLLSSRYFKTELEALREEKANTEATSGVEGGSGQSSAKETAEYWLQKGTPPTPEDVPNKKKRREIVQEFIKQGNTQGKTFYND